MKQKILTLSFILFISTKIFAQNFYGFVKKADSTSSSIYQANIEIMEGDKPFKTLKTYFDGAFKFTLGKEKGYSIKISYSGYKDTTYVITTDKKGMPSTQNVTVRLPKDGMRLMGVIKNQEEKFPIKDATIVLKNVMTRKEDRQTTGIDGRFNFKLEYETNYRVSIDKFSPGIFNKYKDTAFYISTIGFNQPLDYKLDIILDELLYPATAVKVREGYNSSRQATNKVKPVIEVVAIKKTPDDSVIASAISDNATSLVEKEKGKENSIAMANLNSAVQKLKDDSVTQAKAKQDSVDRVKAEQEKLAEELAVKKVYQDSVTKAIVAARIKFIQDSVSNFKAEIAARAKAKQDSVARVAVEKEKIAKELVAKKAHQDSVNKAVAAARMKFIQDSINNVREELAARAKAKLDSVARVTVEKEKLSKVLATKKAYQDSIAKTIVTARIKFIGDSINNVRVELAARAKAKLDSITRAKIEQQRIAKELVLKKVFQDSVNKAAAIVRIKFVEDSTIRAFVSARIKFIRDSVSSAFSKSIENGKAEKDSVVSIKMK